MGLSDSDKITVLLNLLNCQIDEIRRREQTEQKLFEWATSLLLASFGVIVALSQKAALIQHAIIVKFIATILVSVPIGLITFRILGRSKASMGNAEAVERIQDLLHLFEDGYYGSHSPYPKVWSGTLAAGRLKRKSPIYNSVILALMAGCLVTTIWLIL